MTLLKSDSVAGILQKIFEVFRSSSFLVSLWLTVLYSSNLDFSNLDLDKICPKQCVRRQSQKRGQDLP